MFRGCRAPTPPGRRVRSTPDKGTAAPPGARAPHAAPLPAHPLQGPGPWREATRDSGPRAAPRPRPAAAPGMGAGAGAGGRGRGLPLGATEHAAAGEGGHREIGKRGPERVRHDPAAATWWQVRQRQRRRGERARGGGCSRSGRGGRGRGRGARAPCCAAAERGRCCASAPAPPAPPGARSLAAILRAHLLLFRGRGKSFWKGKGEKGGDQRGPVTASHEATPLPRGAEAMGDCPRSATGSHSPLGLR